MYYGGDESSLKLIASAPSENFSSQYVERKSPSKAVELIYQQVYKSASAVAEK